MAKMKIYEIARSLQSQNKELKSGDLVKLLNENGFNVKGANSNIEDAEIAFLLKSFKNGATSKPEKTAVKTEKKVEAEQVEKPAKAPKKEEKKAEMPAVKAASESPKPAVASPDKTSEEKSTRPQENNRRPENQARNAGQRNDRRPQGNNTQGSQNGNNRSYQNHNGNAQGQNRTGTGNNYQGQNRNASGNNYQGQNRNGTGNNYQGQNRNASGSNYQGQNRNGSGSNYQGQNRNGTGNNYQGQNRNGTGNNYQGQNRNGTGNNQNRSNNPNWRSNNNNSQGGYNRNQGAGNNNNRGGAAQGGNRGQQQGGVYERFEKTQSSFDGIKQETKTSRQRNKKAMPNKDAKGRYRKSSMVEMNRIRSKKDPNRKGAFIKPEPVAKEPEEKIKEISIPENLTIKQLAEKMKMQPSVLIKKLFLQGKMVSVNQDITFEEAEEIALEFDIIAEMEERVDVVAEILKEEDEDEALMEKRPPVVCVMGHVDHGKTSLLDAIREANVTSREAGGITQHIGAYVVDVNGEKITFLDTPGHEAFTSMRMRGAQSTDIAILVVAADDGVMPQTIEAINHAKAAEVEIIVAINKIDKAGANLERVKQELAEYELIPEDWGGSTIFVPVSAHTKEGIEQLLEMIVLTADVLELKANKERKARGIVIEAQLDKGRGPVATLLVQKGTLHVSDNVVIGSATGKVRAMIDHTGERIKVAGPSTPVELLGLNGVPDAGEIFVATDTDKEAKNIASAYIEQGKEKLLEETKSKKLSLDGLFSQIQAGNIKELNLIIKADVQGSVQAVKQSLVKLSNEEVAIRVIHGGVGAINESDVSLAIASNAIIIGFNIRPDNMAKEVADREDVDIRLYRVIYDAIEDIEAAMKGMLEPIYEEKIIGHAEIRQTFKASGVGTIAGSYVLDGKIERGCSARITRGDKQIFEGPVASLKRMKDDVKEVAAGYECGMVFEKFNDVEEEDKIECYMMVEVPR